MDMYYIIHGPTLKVQLFGDEQVEGILLQHPGIVGTVIVGVPDAHLTEMVVACVELREHWHWSHGSFEHSSKNKVPVLSGAILRRYCREKNLTGYPF